MIEAGKKRGYIVDSISRRIYPEHDFSHFDLILGMDSANMKDINALAHGDELENKLFLMTHHHPTAKEVFDPYFGGQDGFDLVLDLLEECCDLWIKHFVSNRDAANDE